MTNKKDKSESTSLLPAMFCGFNLLLIGGAILMYLAVAGAILDYDVSDSGRFSLIIYGAILSIFLIILGKLTDTLLTTRSYNSWKRMIIPELMFAIFLSYFYFWLGLAVATFFGVIRGKLKK
jgi:hypothetical protein